MKDFIFEVSLQRYETVRLCVLSCETFILNLYYIFVLLFSATIHCETMFRLVAILKEVHIQLSDHDNELAHIVVKGK